MKEKYTEYIDHEALVVSVDTRRGVVRVKVSDAGECGSCPAARLCSMGSREEENDNHIDVATKHVAAYKPGDKVKIRGTEKMHRRAVTLVTVLPSVALVAVMVGIYMLTDNQLAAALGGLGTTIFFFVLLYLCRNHIAHEFSFELI